MACYISQENDSEWEDFRLDSQTSCLTLDLIMHYRNKIDEISSECISAILAEKEKNIPNRNVTNKYHEIIKERLDNLSLQQKQFEKLISDTKLQFSFTHESSLEEVEEKFDSVVNNFEKECNLFSQFFPAFAFIDNVLNNLKYNQLQIICSDNYYGFNHVLPFALIKQCPNKLIISCESFEETTNQLHEWMSDFLGEKVVTIDKLKNCTKNKILCVSECELLEVLSSRKCIIKELSYIIFNISLVRSVECDILLACFLDTLKMNNSLRLIIIISPYSNLHSYQSYFDKSLSVSVFKTKNLKFPVITTWKKDDLTPNSNYIEEVVKTVLSIITLSKTGDILAFLPLPKDVKCAAEILNQQLCQLSINWVDCVLICDDCHYTLLSESLIEVDVIERTIFLATDCAESMDFPSVQFVVDCGIQTVSLYDNLLNTSIERTIFISRQKSRLRKSLVSFSDSGFYYCIYSKKNYCKDMLKADYPKILVENPFISLLKFFQLRDKIPFRINCIEFFSQKTKQDVLQTFEKYGIVENSKLTMLGLKACRLPFDVKYSKLLLLGIERELAFEAVVLVAFLTSKLKLFQSSTNERQQRIIDAVKIELIQNNSDTLTYLYIYRNFIISIEWCKQHYIRHKTLQNIESKVFEICKVLHCCLNVNINQTFSEGNNDFSITELLFDCFHENLCVFSGHSKSGYKILSTSTFAFINPTSISHQIYNQFILFDHMVCMDKNFLFHVTTIPYEVVAKSLSNGSLNIDHADLFEQVLNCRTIEPVGEEVLNSIFGENRENLKIIETQIRKETGNDSLFLEVPINKGQIFIYAFAADIDCAQCVVDDMLKSKLDNMLEEHEVETIELKKGQNKMLIDINWSKGATVTSLSFNLSMKVYDRKKNILDTANEFADGKEFIFPYYLSISWLRRECSGDGYVTFNCDKSFMSARKMSLRYIKLFQTEIFVQVSSKGKNQLHFSGIPSEVSIKAFEKEMLLLFPDLDIVSIELGYKPIFETPDEEIDELKSKILHELVVYDIAHDCDIIIPKPEPKDLEMFVYIYAYDNEILNFLGEIVSSVVVKDKKFINEILFNVDIKFDVNVCKALQSRFLFELKKLESDLKTQLEYRTDFHFHVHINLECNDRALIKLSSHNNEILKLIQRKVNSLLEGELLNSANIKDIGNLFFYNGHLWLKDLEKTENMCIIEDNKLKTIRLYGSPESCENARSEIKKFLEDIESDIIQVVPLASDQNSCALLKAIIKEYGTNLEEFVLSYSLRTAFLSIKEGHLLLRGRQENIEKAIDSIKALASHLNIVNIITETSKEVCPVCTYPISNASIRLEHCGHLYCLECIQLLVEQAEFPICCCFAKCGKDIVLKDIRKILNEDSKKIRTLSEKSMKDYLERNHASVVFCPTPDCDMFFFKSQISGNKMNCPLCHNDICIKCHVMYHGGYTCEMYQNSKKDPDYSFRVWQKTTTQCKQCPRCKTAIEKISGCNRMYCSSCKGTFCWLCVKEFPSESAVYSHIESSHRGMLYA